jgi:hypothetical protein
LKAVLGQDDGRRVDDHHAGIAVDDDPVVLAHQLAGTFARPPRRNVHAARHDGGVRGLAAHVGDKAGKHALLELQHVGRRQVVRHQHQRHIHCVVQQQVLLALALGGVRHTARPRPSCSAGCARTTCSRSALRSRRYSSSISSNWRAITSSCVVSAHSALYRRSVIQCLTPQDQLFVLQQHQVHIQQGGQFMRRLLRAHVADVLQAVHFVDHRVATGAPARSRTRLWRAR